MQTPQNSGVTGTTGSPHTPALSFPQPLWEKELQGKKQAEDQLAIQAKNLSLRMHIQGLYFQAK